MSSPSAPTKTPSASEELQAKPFTPYGACRKVWDSQAFEILIAGPAGTGKTRSDLEEVFCAAMKYPGCCVLIVRKTRAELSETALRELEEHVFPPDWRRWGGKAKRQQRSVYHLPNGSIIVCGGMDDPMKILSSEYDRILVIEAVQLTEEDYELLTTRCRATHTPYQQVICETNPSSPAHWLKRRAESGKMDFFTSTHRDNPKYYDPATGLITKDGEHYIKVVLGNLTGSRKARLLDGIWCADEHAVFDYDVLKRHLDLCREPTYRLRITHTLDGARRDESIKRQRHEDVVCTRQPAAENPNDWQNHLLWWGDLIKDPNTGRLRPPQDRTYILSADISGGNEASNSIIAIADRNTRTKVGEWVSATISPGGLARMMAMLGLWCGGARKVGHLIWEANYPGPHFGRQLSRVLAYPSLHRREQGTAKTFGTTSQELGWFNSQTALRDGVEALRDAYARDEYHNPSEQAIQEAMQWLRSPTGKLGPGHLMEESADARQTHGDRCFVAGTMIRTASGDKPIETIRIGEMVQTRRGPRRVIAAAPTGMAPVFTAALSNGQRLTGTGNHPIWTENRGWVPLSSLTPRDSLMGCQEPTAPSREPRPSFSKVPATTAAQILHGSTCAGISGAARSGMARRSPCTSPSGPTTTAPFPPDTSSTTKTRTRSTTTSPTSPLSHGPSTGRSTALVPTLKARDTSPSTSTPAPSAASRTRLGGSRSRGFAGRTARTSISALGVWPRGEREVFNLSVEGEPEYFAEGVLVHNCIADIMLVIGMQIDLPTIKDARTPTGFWTPDRIHALDDTPSDDIEDGAEISY